MVVLGSHSISGGDQDKETKKIEIDNYFSINHKMELEIDGIRESDREIRS